jgi:hypothetical protein
MKVRNYQIMLNKNTTDTASALVEAQAHRPAINDSISGRASVGLNDSAFALDAAQAEKTVASLAAQVQELQGKAQAASIEYATFVEKASQYNREADEIEGGMADTMRSGGDVDKVSLRAASARSKARAALQAAQMAKAEEEKIEINLQVRYRALEGAVRGRAGIVFRAKAQEFASAIVKLRPAVNELRELASLSGMTWNDGTGLVPNFAVPEVAGIRFDII